MIVTKSELAQNLIDVTGLQSVELRTLTLDPKVIPIIDISQRTTQVLQPATSAVTGTTTVYTTPADKDFFITYAQLVYTKDVTCDGVVLTLSCVVGGLTKIFLKLAFNTVTLKDDHTEVPFNYPIKCDRGTIIQMSGTFTAGAMSKTACIGGYLQ